MRLLIVGTGPFAVPLLRDLSDSPHSLVGVVTKPVDEGGRRKQPANPVRDAALELALPIHTPADINAEEFLTQLRAWRLDLLVVCDYGRILSPACLRCARLGGINLHGSLLPKYRGAAPIQRAVLAGESTTGVSVIHMTPRLDAGPLLVTASTAIGPEETAAELEPRLAALGVPAVREAVAMLEAWDQHSPLGTPQDPRDATRAPRIGKEEGALNWSQSAEVLHRQIRAFQPWPGSFTAWIRSGSSPLRLIVQRARIAEPASRKEAAPGTVVEASTDRLVVACGTGYLSLERVQPAGKREMEIAEFLRGNPIRVGEQLQLPQAVNDRR